MKASTAFSKREPTISNTAELSQTELGSLLSWYREHTNPQNAETYLKEYLVKHQIEFNEKSLSGFVVYHPTVGYVCRLIMRGAILPDTSLRWIERKIAMIPNYQAPKDIGNDRPIPASEPVKKPTVQDHMKIQVSKCVGDLEGALDEYILSNCTKGPSPLQIFQQHQIKGPQAIIIITWFKRVRDEYRLAASGTDPILREGYSNFTITQLNKLAQYCDQIMNDGLAIFQKMKDERAPRKRKRKTPEQITKKVRYQKEDAELGLTSLSPTKMVGAEFAWTYNTKTRMLTLHAADDATGLSFRGMSVVNTAKTICMSKRLRKPKETLQLVLNGRKTIVKSLMRELTTKPSAYKHRMNSDTIIVKVH